MTVGRDMTGPGPRRGERRRASGALLARTALCGALAGLAAAVAAPASAQSLMPVWSGQAQASGAGPSINIGPTTGTVTLNSARTVVDWTSFNLAAGNSVTFNFGARSWIVLNRINDNVPDTISGTVQGLVNGAYGGNVWFSSRNGLIFGSGAVVDAGGLLVTASSPNLTQFLDPTNLKFDFSGAALGASGVIQIQSGATLTGHGGLVALVAQNITSDQNSAVNGVNGSSVLYGVGETYTVRLVQTLQGDFDLVDFIVPDAGSGSSLGIGVDLQNTTSANSVFVAGVSRAQLASAVISLQGMITAQAVTTDGGDIILSGGGGIVGRLPGPAVAGSTPTDIYLGNLSASRDIRLTNLGLVIATPFPRTPKVIVPPNLESFFDGSFFCDTCLVSFIAAQSPPSPPPPPPFSSVLVAGRDIAITDAQEVDIGSASAGRGLSVDSDILVATMLSAGSGGASLGARGGALKVGQLTSGGPGAITAKTLLEVDAFSRPAGGAGTLAFTAGGDIMLGNGTGDSGGGPLSLAAGGGAIVNLGGAANFSTVTAGASAILQAGTLTVGSVSAQQVVAQGHSVTVGQATSAGDVYVQASAGNASLGAATAGDDVLVLATGGSASLTSATLTGLGPDSVGAPVGVPDSPDNGRIVSVMSADLDARLGNGTGAVTGATRVTVRGGQDAFVSSNTALPSTLSVIGIRDVSLQAPTVSFSGISAGRDLTLIATAGDFATTQNLAAVRNITLGAAGNLSVANINAASGSIVLSGKTVTAGALTAALDLSVASTGGNLKTGALSAGQDLSVQASGGTITSGAISAGRDLTLVSTVGDVTNAQNITATRNITLGAGGVLSVANITANSGAITLSGGSVTAGVLSASTNVKVTATAGGLTTGAITAGLDITLTSNGGVTAQALNAGEDLTLKSTGGGVQIASYRVGRDLLAQGTTISLGVPLSLGRDLSITTPGDFTAAGDLTAGRNIALVVGGSANLKALTAPQVITLDVQGKAVAGGAIAASDVHIVAGDLDLTGSITASTVEIESRTGALRLGGTAADGAPASGLWLDAAEFGRIHAGASLTLYAGALAGAARGDLTVLNLDVNPAAVPLINLFAGGGRNVVVLGTLAPTTPGGAVRIGDASTAAWQPASILISGALGAATFGGGAYSAIRDFNDVRLHAQQDIIMGSTRFIGVIQATPVDQIDLGSKKPTAAVATSAELNKVFLSAGRIELSAAGKVVNQNTSSDPTQTVGIFLTSKSSPDLVIDPPQIVDIFGSFLGKTGGTTVTSFNAGSGLDFTVVNSQGQPTSIPTGASYRFNSCTVGTSNCTGATKASSGTISQTGPVSLSYAGYGYYGSTATHGTGGYGTYSVGSSDSDAGPLGDLGGPLKDAAATSAATSPGSAEAASEAATRNAPGRTPQRPLAAVGPRDPNAALNDPVTTGAGSEEIWRSREAKP